MHFSLEDLSQRSDRFEHRSIWGTLKLFEPQKARLGYKYSKFCKLTSCHIDASIELYAAHQNYHTFKKSVKKIC